MYIVALAAVHVPGSGILCVRSDTALPRFRPVHDRLVGGKDAKVIYRHYATLYFVFVVDSSESELGILDLIQVWQWKDPACLRVLLLSGIPTTTSSSGAPCMALFVRDNQHI